MSEAGRGKFYDEQRKGMSGTRVCECIYIYALITAVFAVFGQLGCLSNRDAGEARILGPRALVIIANYGRGGRLKAIFACMRGIHAIQPESRDAEKRTAEMPGIALRDAS